MIVHDKRLKKNKLEIITVTLLTKKPPPLQAAMRHDDKREETDATSCTHQYSPISSVHPATKPKQVCFVSLLIPHQQ